MTGQTADKMTDPIVGGVTSGFFDPAAGLALVGHNRVIYDSLLRSFIDHHRPSATQVDRWIGQAERQELVRFCHTAKSTTGHVGSSFVQQQARALEHQLKSASGPLSSQEIADLLGLVQHVQDLAELAARYLAGQEPASGPAAIASAASSPATATTAYSNPATIAGPADRDLLWQQFRAALNEHDPRTSRRILEQLRDSPGLASERQALAQLENHLLQYQYEPACQLADQIIAKRKQDS